MHLFLLQNITTVSLNAFSDVPASFITLTYIQVKHLEFLGVSIGTTIDKCFLPTHTFTEYIYLIKCIHTNRIKYLYRIKYISELNTFTESTTIQSNIFTFSASSNTAAIAVGMYFPESCDIDCSIDY